MKFSCSVVKLPGCSLSRKRLQKAHTTVMYARPTLPSTIGSLLILYTVSRIVSEIFTVNIKSGHGLQKISRWYFLVAQVIKMSPHVNYSESILNRCRPQCSLELPVDKPLSLFRSVLPSLRGPELEYRRKEPEVSSVS